MLSPTGEGHKQTRASPGKRGDAGAGGERGKYLTKEDDEGRTAEESDMTGAIDEKMVVNAQPEYLSKGVYTRNYILSNCL